MKGGNEEEKVERGQRMEKDVEKEEVKSGEGEREVKEICGVR